MLFGLFGKSFNPDSDIPDLSGKVFLVTGGNTGLGKETVLQLAKHHAEHIYLAARTQSKAEAAIASVKESVPEAKITFIPLDLTSFESVKAAADEFTRQSQRLDVLVNNAGVMATPAGQETKDGYELQFGTNHMGHALLTKLLLPTLRKTAADSKSASDADVRIVNVSSEGHNMAFRGLNTDTELMKRGNPWGRYGNSKLANILHAKGLTAHESPTSSAPGITAVSLHPGVILTDLYAHSTQKFLPTRIVMNVASRLLFKDVPQGTHTQLWAATAPKQDLTPGAYYTSPGGVSGGSRHAKSTEQRDRLWEYTEKELAAKGY